MEIDKLSETRKADRAKIALLVSDLLTELKVDHKWTREGFDEAYPKAHVISIMAPEGLCVRVELDGDSCQPNVHVLPWHFDLKSDTCFDNRFGDINPHHFQKATLVAYGTQGLLDHLRRQLTMALDGTAFNEERKAASIAKHGTWQERDARWEQWRAEERAKKGVAA